MRTSIWLSADLSALSPVSGSGRARRSGEAVEAAGAVQAAVGASSGSEKLERHSGWWEMHLLE